MLAFDGVNGHVIAWGMQDGAGALHALTNDVWTRLADAPALTSTAVEDPTSGRVHFVCRGSTSSLLT